jgi:2,4-dienoyl-CoA reductase-like NADH-dependent reductase (Old Yellow Enzyme family)
VAGAAGAPYSRRGGISQPEQAEAIITDSSADLFAVGRAALYDPWWARHAATAMRAPMDWPPPYNYGGRFARRHVLDPQTD